MVAGELLTEGSLNARASAKSSVGGGRRVSGHLFTTEAQRAQRLMENGMGFVSLCALCASVVKQFLRAHECNHLHRDDSVSFP